MAHGFGGVRAARLEAFGERFAAAGIAALAFDYRHLGTSQGQPRGLIDITRQRDDYRAAVRCARSLPDIDADRVAVWGTSFSSGHALTVAADDPRIAAAVIMNPYVDGLAAVHKSRKAAGLRVSVALTARWLADEVQRLRSRPPVRVDLTGPPGSSAVFTTPDAAEGYASILPADRSSWEPAIPARVLLRLMSDRPVRRAPDVQCPLLVCVCDHDTIAPISPALKVARNAPRGSLVRYPYQHFDVFTGDGFERAVTDHSAFLRQALL
jgi:alpha-beta hydrolase superfamily lysophospholipase